MSGKRIARQILDRIALPYVEQSVREVTAALDGRQRGPSPEPIELHAVLHWARTLALAEVRRGADVVLSAGANGLWYFDWFEEAYGRVKTHIGVEAYMPRPEGLPENVQWVEADLAGQEGVAAVDAETVDLVFSGQNVEHLWPDQMAAFFCESNRVLKPGGLLVMDSPNRDFTRHYRWSMSEHTVEMTPSEATNVLHLAGFSVERMRGVWLCREGNQPLELDPPGTMIGPDGLLARMTLASGRPEDSFIWWAEARKVGQPDVDGLRAAIQHVFEVSWPERVARVKPADGAPITMPDGTAGVLMPRGTQGYALLGPYLPVPRGRFNFTLPVTWSDCSGDSGPLCRLDLVAYDELMETVEFNADSAQGEAVLSCAADFVDLRFAVHARLWCSGTADVRAPLTLSMAPEPWRTAALE